MMTFILNLIYSFLNWLIQTIFPVGEGFSSEIHTAAETLGGYYKSLDILLPLNALENCLLILITFQILIFTFKNFEWLLSYIPFLRKK